MTTITIKCSVCNTEFERLLKQYKYQLKVSGENYKPLCGSNSCKESFRTAKQLVTCQICNKEFHKKQSQIKKTLNNFCSSSCSAKFTNSNRSLDYNRTKTIKCKTCSIEFKVNAHSTIINCESCKKSNVKITFCQKCNSEITPPRKVAKYCDPCRKYVHKKYGEINGKISAVSQQRRSKNEILFYNLCAAEFNNVKHNDPCFVSPTGNWDADVVLHDHKVAVLWNGVWHYKKIHGDHSLAQVQQRDKIKLQVIANNGYTSYTVQDNGKHNVEFVRNEFLKFKSWLHENRINSQSKK